MCEIAENAVHLVVSQSLHSTYAHVCAVVIADFQAPPTSKTCGSCRAVRQQGVLLGACQVGRQDKAAHDRAPSHPAADSDGRGPRWRQWSLLAAAGDRPGAGLPAQGNLRGCTAAHTGDMIQLVSSCCVYVIDLLTQVAKEHVGNSMLLS